MPLSSRTADDVRTYANEHYTYIEERPQVLGALSSYAAQYTRVGRAILEEVLALPEGGIFDLGEWLAKQDSVIGKDPAIAFSNMPFLTGACNLLKWEFSHTEVGLIPLDVVRELLDGKEPVPYKGQTLFLDSVLTYYRRLPL